MRKLGSDIPAIISAMGGDSSQARVNLRAREVRSRYKEALESVYGPMAEHFLAHTNNVYIMMKDGVRTLIVYVDESIWAAELNAQRELIRLRLLELFGEQIERFDIHISRGNYKDNHPYASETPTESQQQAPSIPLDPNERSYVSDTVSTIQDERLRESFRSAMTADMEWKKGEKELHDRKNAK